MKRPGQWNRHDWERAFWDLMIVPTLIWWKESVLWVAIMSLYANRKTADGASEAADAKAALAQEGSGPRWDRSRHARPRSGGGVAGGRRNV